jgi:hypothetical protein
MIDGRLSTVYQLLHVLAVNYMQTRSLTRLELNDLSLYCRLEHALLVPS